ncbi:hypothetical protein [Robiginitalea sediminis]|uniref:hypothetical protein n=1 Tax=Robiginitalea sediminis TaxID=1982593 RepID=UPI00117B229A|nr:hypothetical protein [Robiginitalea sediminis]
MNTTKKFIYGLFAMSVLVLASCTANSSDDVYDSVDKRYVTKDNDKQGVDKRYVTKGTDGVDKRYVTTGN